MSAPVCIDSKAIDWKVPEGKFKNTLLKVLYDKASGQPERIYLVSVRPGGAITMHKHPKAEVFYIISGEGVVTCEGQRFEDLKGKVFFARPGVEHDLINTGSEDVVLISFATEG